MKIVFDLQGCQTLSRYRGIGNYSHSLAKAIIHRANQNGHDIVILLNSNLPEGIEDVKKSFDGIVDPQNILIWNCPKVTYQNTWKRNASELIRERFIYHLNPDIIHISSFFETEIISSIGKYYEDCITAVTLYDLVPYLNFDHYLSNKEVRNWYLEKIENLKKADLLLAISESARLEALETSIFKHNNIINISSDVDSAFRKLKVDEKFQTEFKKRFKINSKYIMCTSPLCGDARKNVENLIIAYALLDPQLRKNHQLVLVGNYDDYALKRIKELRKEWNLNENEIILTSYIDTEDLVLLYNLCKLFVFPSLHEGFGLPILEAMRCGAPVIASNRSSMPGIIGLKEALFDPLDPKDLAEKMQRALTDQSYSNRLVENSKEQEKMYSWKESAKYALDAFELLYDKKIQKKKIQILNYQNVKDTFFFKKYGIDALKFQDLIGLITQIKEFPQDKEDIQSVVEMIGKNERFWKRTDDLDLVFYGPIKGEGFSSYNRGIIAALISKNIYNVYVQPDEMESALDIDNSPQADSAWLEKYFTTRNIINNPCLSIYTQYPFLKPKDRGGINIAMLCERELSIPESEIQKLSLYYDGIIVGANSVKKLLIDFGFKKPIELFPQIDCSLMADKIIEFSNKILFSSLSSNEKKQGVKIKLGWVSSWNTKCGIAEYSAFLLNEFEREAKPFRIYACNQKDDTIPSIQNFSVSYCQKSIDGKYEFPYEEIINDKIDVIVVQYNYAFFDFNLFVKYVCYLIEQGIKVIVFFHCTATLKQFDKDRVNKLKSCDRILVHTIKDVNLLKSYDRIENVTLFPHGSINNVSNEMLQKVNQFSNHKGIIIGSYGFFLPSKGIYQLIGAFSQIIEIIPNSKLILTNAAFPIIDSYKEIERCVAYAKELGVYDSIEWHTDFKTNEESLTKMRECDLLVFPYQDTKESSSAAVRFGLASGMPVLTSPISIFDEVKDVTYQTTGITSDEIKEGILNFIKNKNSHFKLRIKQRRWLLNHDWKNVGKRMEGMIKSLVLNSKEEDEIILKQEDDLVLAKFL